MVSGLKKEGVYFTKIFLEYCINCFAPFGLKVATSSKLAILR